MSEKTIEQSRQHLLALTTVADSEISLLMKGNKSAAGRARKSLQQLKTVCHELRKSIIEHLKTLPKRKVAPASSFKKKTAEVEPAIQPVAVVETKVVEDVKEPEPPAQEAKPKRTRKAVVKKVILSPEAEIIKQAKKA